LPSENILFPPRFKILVVIGPNKSICPFLRAATLSFDQCDVAASTRSVLCVRSPKCSSLVNGGLLYFNNEAHPTRSVTCDFLSNADFLRFLSTWFSDHVWTGCCNTVV